MSLVLQADNKRIVLLGLVSAIGIFFGFTIYKSIPSSNVIRWAFLIVPILVSFNVMWSVMRRRIVVSKDGILVVNSYSRMWIPISEIAGWKIKENHRNPSFHLLTRTGERIDVFRVGMLGVSNLGVTSMKIAKELAESGRNIGNFSE
jgi:hypothetical protein